MNILAWTNYFELLAARHKDILHSSNSKHFFRGELDEFWQDIRSKAKFPALMLESTILDVASEPNSLSTTRTLAFVIADSCKADDFREITKVQSKCEGIATAFLDRINRDVSLGKLGNVRLQSAHLEPIENVPMHYYGQRVELVVTEVCCYYKPNTFTDE